MTIKINYSSDIGGAQSGVKDQNPFRIASREKRNEIFDKYEGVKVTDKKKKPKTKGPFSNTNQLNTFEDQMNKECDDVFNKTIFIDDVFNKTIFEQKKPFNEMNYVERNEFLKNYNDLTPLNKKCLKFDKDNQEIISEKAKKYCDEIPMEDYQDYIKYNPNLCPDYNKKFTYMKLCDDIAKKFITDNNNQNNVNKKQGLKRYLSEAERGKNIIKKPTYTENVQFEYLPDKLEETRGRILEDIVILINKEFPFDTYDVQVQLRDEN